MKLVQQALPQAQAEAEFVTRWAMRVTSWKVRVRRYAVRSSD